MRSFFRAFAVLALFALTGCDSTDPGEDVDPGFIRLTHTGGLAGLFETGAFEAEGAPSLDTRGRPDFGEWALGGPHPERPANKMIVVGYRGQSPREGRLIAVTMSKVTGPDSVAIDENCLATNCSRVLLLFGVDPARPHDGVEGSCEIGEGSLHVTAVSGSRIQGTFSGSGHCVRDIRTDTLQAFGVTSGEFDVSIAETYRSGLQIEIE